MTDTTPFGIITEYMNQGTLYDLLHNKRVRVTNKQILKVALSVAQGMHYLHSQKPTILHKGNKLF
jgi:serine/threonine protein kinase